MVIQHSREVVSTYPKEGYPDVQRILDDPVCAMSEYTRYCHRVAILSRDKQPMSYDGWFFMWERD